MTETQNQVAQTLNIDYKDIEFLDLMKEVIKETTKLNSIYCDLIKKSEFNIDNLNKSEDLESIPYITTASFKEKENLYEKLLKIPVTSPKFEYWNVSTATSGNASLVGVDQDDLKFLFEMAKKCFLDFIPRDWDRAHLHFFSPSHKMLDRFVMRYTKVKPTKSYSSNFYKVANKMAPVKYLMEFKLPAAIKETIKQKTKVGAFDIKFNYLLDVLEKNSKKPKNEQIYPAIGGSCQMIQNFIGIMRQKQITYNLGTEFDVVIGGGGWDGHKAQLKSDPVDKAQFVNSIVNQFGTKASQIVDIYGFTETPIIFGSHWSSKHEDFIMHCPSYAKVLIRDIDTLEPLKKSGDRGFLEVLTPFGAHASVNHAILVDDLVELISKDTCPECGHVGDTFSVLGRIKKKEGLGCSSVIKWI